MLVEHNLPELYKDLRMRLKHEQICGYKVGATNPAAQRMLGLTTPFYAFLLKSKIFTSGTRLRLPPEVDRVTIEPEICYELHAQSEVTDDPHALIAKIWLSIEVVSPPGGTFEGLSFDKLIETNGIHFCLIRSQQTLSGDMEISADMPVQVFVNSTEMVTGSPANVLGHPLNSLEWLSRNADEPLTNNSARVLVTTGSCTSVVTAGRGDKVSVVFGNLGQVSFVIEV